MGSLTSSIQSNQYYIGAAKQVGWDTGLAPTWFWRWLKGTSAGLDTKIAKEREGDGGPFINLVYKESEHVIFKLVEYARPQTCGYALQGLLGTGSDTYTAPSKSTTLAALVAAGATSFSSTADLGSVGTVAVNFSPGYSSAVYEVKMVNLVSKTGTGPYVYNLVAGQSFAYAHPNTDPITTQSKHVLTRQQTTYDPYCFEDGFTTAGIGKAFRSLNCVCVELHIVAEQKKPVKFESTWWGTSRQLLAALSSPTFEGNGLIGTPGAPFHFRDAASTWSLDGGTTGNALAFTKLDLTLKNSTNADDLLTELLNPSGFLPGTIDISGNAELVFQSYAQYLNTYFGSSAAGANTVDSALVGTGSLAATFQPDGVNGLGLNLPSIAYTAAKMEPDDQAKPLKQPLTFDVVRLTPATVPFTATLTNSFASAY